MGTTYLSEWPLTMTLSTLPKADLLVLAHLSQPQGWFADNDINVLMLVYMLNVFMDYCGRVYLECYWRSSLSSNYWSSFLHRWIQWTTVIRRLRPNSVILGSEFLIWPGEMALSSYHSLKQQQDGQQAPQWGNGAWYCYGPLYACQY